MVQQTGFLYVNLYAWKIHKPSHYVFQDNLAPAAPRRHKLSVHILSTAPRQEGDSVDAAQQEGEAASEQQAAGDNNHPAPTLPQVWALWEHLVLAWC